MRSGQVKVLLVASPTHKSMNTLLDKHPAVNLTHVKKGGGCKFDARIKPLSFWLNRKAKYSDTNDQNTMWVGGGSTVLVCFES